MPRKSNTRNALGTILKKEVTRAGRKITVYDVRKRTPVLDESGRPVKIGEVTKYKDITKRCYSKQEAIATLSRIASDVDQRLHEQTNPERTLFDLCEYFADTYIKPAVFVRGRKVAGYKTSNVHLRSMLNEYKEYFGNIPLKELTYEHLKRFQEALTTQITFRGDFPKPSTINEKMSFLRRVLNVAVQLDWILRSPFTRGTGLVNRSAEEPRTRILTFEEESRLLAACTGRRRHLKALIICAVDTGLRRGEIFNLTWHDVDLNNMVIRIDRDESKSKTGQAGFIPITDRLHEIFVKMRKGQKPSDHLFPKMEFKRSWATLLRNAGIEDLQFRDLRSTASTRFLHSGVSGELIRKIVRNSEKVFEKNYTVLDVPGTQAIGQALSDYLSAEAAKVAVVDMDIQHASLEH